RLEQVPRFSQSVAGLIRQDRLPQNRVGARLQRLWHTAVVLYDGEGQGTLCCFALAGCLQDGSSFRLVIPINDDEMEMLAADSFRRVTGYGAVFTLNAKISQYLANGLSRSIVRGEQEAAKGHASPD